MATKRMKVKPMLMDIVTTVFISFGFKQFILILIILVLGAFLPACISAEEAEFHVERIGQMVSHWQNAFAVTAPLLPMLLKSSLSCRFSMLSNLS